MEPEPFLIELHLGSPLVWVGLALSVLGIAFNIWALLKTKGAAETARKAITDLKGTLANVNSIASCTRALAIIEEIKRHQRNSIWNLLPDRYSELRRLLLDIRSSIQDLDSARQQSLHAAIAQLSTIENQIEIHLADGAESIDVAKLNRIVSKQADRIAEIISALRDEIGADHDS